MGDRSSLSPTAGGRKASMRSTNCLNDQYPSTTLDMDYFSNMIATEGKLDKLGTKHRLQDHQETLNKMEDFLKECEGGKVAGVGENVILKMKLILSRVSDKNKNNKDDVGFNRIITSLERRRTADFVVRMHKKMKPVGKILKKMKAVEEQRREAASLSEGDERARVWQTLSKKYISKASRTLGQNISTKISSARRIAALCCKEQNKHKTKLMRHEVRDVSTRSKKIMKEMLQFWKRNEKEERELRKRAEKEAADRRRQEEEEREAKRQQKKLHFLLTQTELYSHFIARKGPESPTETASKVSNKPTLSIGVDFADLDETQINEHARQAAEKAFKNEKDKMKRFDAESDLKRKEALGESGGNLTNELGNFDLTSPSTLAAAQVEVRQPRMLNCELKSYQLKGLTWLANLYEQGINGILADEMGLGKTVQAVALMAHLAEVHNIWGPFLVIAPASTLHNWQQELSRFAPSLRALPYWGNVKDRTTLRRFWGTKRLYTKDSSFHVLITSYQLVVADEKYFQRVKWQYMVLDEAQAIKSSSSVRWKTLLSFPCRNRLLLTGTPIQNSMQELWALLHFIMPGLFDSHDEFSDWFAKDIESHAVAAEARSGTSTLSAHQLQRLHIILKPFMLRRIKKDVQNELGTKIEIDIECSLTGRQKTLYRGIREKLPMAEILALSASSSSTSTDTLMNIVMQFRKVCNHPELFERSEVISPFVVHYPEPAPLANSSNRFFSRQSPVIFEVPKLLSDLMEEPVHKRLEFELSPFSASNVKSYFGDYKDPFAVTAFSTFLSRGDIPKILQQGMFGFGLDLTRRISDYEERWAGHVEDTSLIPSNFDDLVPSSVRYFIREPALYIPPAVSTGPRLVFRDSNLAMKEKITKGSTCLSDKKSLSFGESDVMSGRDIGMPNLAKLIVDSGKMLALDNLLAELKAGDHRVLVYNQMTKMIDLMEEYLRYRNYTYIRLDGSSKIADRRDLVADWQNRSDIFVFLLSTRAGGLGINLTAADTVIFYDSDWNPTVDQQAMDRAHRLGQTKQVTVYRLITRNSIEERMRQRAKQKDEIHKVVIAGGEFQQLEASKPNQKDIVSLLLEEQDGGETVSVSSSDAGSILSKKPRLK